VLEPEYNINTGPTISPKARVCLYMLSYLITYLI
jgi:hypothetical protein